VNKSTLTPAAERILDVAGRLFYANGIHAVGVELIAGQAGVTKKTLYDRFGSKDELVTRYLRRRHERWCRHVLAVVERNPRTPLAKQLLLVFDARRVDSDRELPRLRVHQRASRVAGR
jgi:AcrR family transcriptional regulator